MFGESERDTTVLLGYQLNEDFGFTKGLYEMRNKERHRYEILQCWYYTDIIENFQWSTCAHN